MPPSRQKLRLSVQAKVLVAVLGFLVLLPAITVWIVDRHISRQLQDEGQQTLTTAEAVFKQSLDIRLRDLQARFRNNVTESSYRSVLTLAETKTPTADNTIRGFLSERIDELGDDYEAIFFVSDADATPVGARRGSVFDLKDFARAAGSITSLALQGEAARGTISLNGRAFCVVAVPVTLPESRHRVGVLTVGVRITEAAVKELKTLKHTEMVLIANNQVAVSTLPGSVLPPQLLREINEVGGSRPQVGGPEIELNGEHFVTLAGAYDFNGPQRGFRYVLLSSFEQRLQALEATRKTLAEVSIVGILLSATVVGLIIRRITQPLRELRDSAEAVGRGDFSHRIRQFSNDECGDLAQAFNRMISNLDGLADRIGEDSGNAQDHPSPVDPERETFGGRPVCCRCGARVKQSIDDGHRIFRSAVANRDERKESPVPRSCGEERPSLPQDRPQFIEFRAAARAGTEARRRHYARRGGAGNHGLRPAHE